MSDHSQQHYYDMRFLVLPLINIVIRPHVALFFSDYTASPHSLLKESMLSLFLVFFLFTSIQLGNLINGGLLVCPGFGYSSAFLTSALLFSLLCPTSVFLYIYHLIILTSLWPPFSLLFRSFVQRLRKALSTFIAPIPVLEEDYDSEGSLV